jgi:hypothetical protein
MAATVRTIADFFEERRTALRRYGGGALTDADIDAMLLMAPDSQVGILSGVIPLEHEARAHIFERVQLTRDEAVTIVQYSYYLIRNGNELRGYDLDPRHDPASHMHDQNHGRTPHDRVTLEQAIRAFWDILSALQS